MIVLPSLRLQSTPRPQGTQIIVASVDHVRGICNAVRSAASTTLPAMLRQTHLTIFFDLTACRVSLGGTKYSCTLSTA